VRFKKGGIKMSLYFDEKTQDLKAGVIVSHILIVVVALVIGGMAGCPSYTVYQQRKAGEALLAHAQFSKEVAVAEAKAKMESAELLAQAEVKRAVGVAQANKIIGDSLRNNEAYLRYLWITDVAGANQGKTVVYVPTEANLPLLEATRLKDK
jgi:ABC-type sulfate transport system substrate-binding protein